MLTERQAEALEAIKAHQAETGLPPTVREMAARLGNTLSSAHALLDHLERRGAISRIPGSPRSIRVL